MTRNQMEGKSTNKAQMMNEGKLSKRTGADEGSGEPWAN